MFWILQKNPHNSSVRSELYVMNQKQADVMIKILKCLVEGFAAEAGYEEMPKD